MKAVFDTNVLISGHLWRGTPYRCLLAVEAGLLELVLAEPILDELREKLVVKFGNTPDQAADVVAGLRRKATMVEIRDRHGFVLADPDDDKFVDAALESSADVIVSGDRHLLTLGEPAGL